jgi:hypothetical protein
MKTKGDNQVCKVLIPVPEEYGTVDNYLLMGGQDLDYKIQLFLETLTKAAQDIGLMVKPDETAVSRNVVIYGKDILFKGSFMPQALKRISRTLPDVNEVSVTAPPSHDALAASQDSDDELRILLGSTNALRLEILQIPGTAVSIYCDTSTGRPRPYVPAHLRLQVLKSVHELSHSGTKATAKLVAERFVCPGVQKDCRTWARACQSCQRSKVSRHTITLHRRRLASYMYTSTSWDPFRRQRVTHTASMQSIFPPYLQRTLF